MIIEDKQRDKKLISNGVPKEFLDAIEDTESFKDLKYIVQGPENAYFYLEEIYPRYNSLRNYDVTPIYCGGNNDTFYVLLTNSEEKRFVYLSLEEDAIYEDFGSDFSYMLANLLIDYYEFADNVEINTLGEYGMKMGFKNAQAFLQALEDADANGLRSSFETDEAWRRENISRFL